ncbi:hypothetical protein Tco_0214565 [Tanacetum coccineum]
MLDEIVSSAVTSTCVRSVCGEAHDEMTGLLRAVADFECEKASKTVQGIKVWSFYKVAQTLGPGFGSSIREAWAHSMGFSSAVLLCASGI